MKETNSSTNTFGMTDSQARVAVLKAMQDRRSSAVRTLYEAITVFMDKHTIGYVGDYWNGEITKFHYVPVAKRLKHKRLKHDRLTG